MISLHLHYDRRSLSSRICGLLRHDRLVICQNAGRDSSEGCFVKSEECCSEMTFHILRDHVLSSDCLSDVPNHIAPLGGLVGGMEKGPTG